MSKVGLLGEKHVILGSNTRQLVLLFLGGLYYEKRQDGLDWNPIFGWTRGTRKQYR
jgi:hypothetical protein